MSEKIHAADAIRASIKQFKALSEFADALEKIGSIEQAEKEAKAAAHTARAEAEKSKEQANKANQLLSVMQEATRLKVIENDLLEKDWIEKAQADVLELKTNAKERANLTLQEAQTKADSLIAGAQSKLIELQTSLADANKQLALVEKNKQRAEDDLAGINAKIEHAKLLVSNVFN